MSSKLQHRCSSILAGFIIAGLLAVIVLLWVLVGNGAFRPKMPKHRYNVTISEQRKTTPAYLTATTHKEPISKDFIETSHLDNVGQFADTEYVKPLKISPLPLHNHDILYDQMRNTNHANNNTIRHHSGHFRRKMAEIWDPHPQYELKAFGQNMILELAHDDKFVAPNLHITHVWENYTERVKHDPKTSGCYYKGLVKGDTHSKVAVSLCNGMTGYIKTSEGNYYIEPVEPFQDNSVVSILHKIKKVTASEPEETNNVNLESDQCETHTNDKSSTLVDEDFHNTETTDHIITKRNVYMDDFEVNEDYSYERGGMSEGSQKNVKQNGPYFIETLVVADQKMAEYHRTDHDLIHYILTLMSHVALLYKDATIGNPITLAVVDIMILKDTEFYSVTTDEKLHEFCNYQYTHSAKTHDVALLLSREDICKNNCTTLGVAEVGSMCSLESSCAIVRDKGLSTSYTIAHELGHVLSMPHDDDNKCMKYQGEVRNIMGKMINNDTKPWQWSKCSKHFVTEFLDSPRSSCLLDVPKKDYITTEYASQHLLPGESFKVNRQCELEFGKGSSICSFMPRCSSLWCSSSVGELSGCKTQHMPWADGTACATGRWCHHGKCIPLDREKLSPIAGGWAEWRDWNDCSRPCGGGIKVSKRDCTNPMPSNGGPYCTGGFVRYSSCNTQKCESDVLDFREEQCANFNGNTKGIQGLTDDIMWVPKYGITNPEDYCKLYCRVIHSSSYYLLKEKVFDGTKCGLNSFNICVNGICQKGGCDNVLGSNTTLDECGICGGDNSKCHVVSGYINEEITNDYTFIVKIPKGSSNVNITQRGANDSTEDDNYLALRDVDTEHHVLNGNYTVCTSPRDIIYGGVTIRYSGSEQIVENITTPRNSKLTKDLLVEVLSSDKRYTPDIHYSYVRENAPVTYTWSFFGDKFSTCDSICSGTQYPIPICMDTTEKIVNDSFCSDLKADFSRIKCNTHCKLVWSIQSRGHCSAQCGSGKRKIFYKCLKQDLRLRSNDREGVDSKHCLNLPQPKKYESCIGPCHSTRWGYEPWTQCSKSCGGGMQIRAAKCINDNRQQIDDSHCNQNDKHTEQPCNNDGCPIWSLGDLTKCSVTCGTGFRTYHIICQQDNRIIQPLYCDVNTKPDLQKHVCEMPACPQQFRWITDVWGDKCDITANGLCLRTRNVNCRTFDDRKVTDAYCADFLKPNTTMPCQDRDCVSAEPYEDNLISNYFKWTTETWSECSTSCGKGTTSRKVHCMNEDGKVKDNYCDQSKRPVHRSECPRQAPCGTWQVIKNWTRCDHNCEKSRIIACQDASGNNIHEKHCTEPKLSAKVKCRKRRCHQYIRGGYAMGDSNGRWEYQWVAGKWGNCSNSCGSGTEKRSIYCERKDTGDRYVDAYCEQLKRKPRHTRKCEKFQCKYAWVEGDWSPCSVTCGRGIKTRNVSCHQVTITKDGYQEKQHYFQGPKHEYCDYYNKPKDIAECVESYCSDMFKWVPGPWSQCSQPCGKGGRQVRQIKCVGKDGKRAKGFCRRDMKPRRKKQCNQKKCVYDSCREVKRLTQKNENQDYSLSIDGKVAKVYCYKMDTRDPEEFISLQPGKDNYAEFYDKRLKDPMTCPYDGHRRHDCDCDQIPNNAGHTMYWKVRLNITSKKIITDDYTFSKQDSHDNANKIPYASSGDCYSMRDYCQQGMFSIDLRDTSFRISREVKWMSTGGARQEIRRHDQDQIITGRCGGNCGTCLPDPRIGLKVEVT